MNPNYIEFKFPQVCAEPFVLAAPAAWRLRSWPVRRSPAPPSNTPPRSPPHTQIRPYPWSKIFRPRAPPEAIDLMSRMLHYVPHSRITALDACSHSFFDELRQPGCVLPNGAPLPPLLESELRSAALDGAGAHAGAHIVAAPPSPRLRTLAALQGGLGALRTNNAEARAVSTSGVAAATARLHVAAAAACSRASAGAPRLLLCALQTLVDAMAARAASWRFYL